MDVDEPTGTMGTAYACAYQSGNVYMDGYDDRFIGVCGFRVVYDLISKRSGVCGRKGRSIMELWIAVVLFTTALAGCIICAVAARQKKSRQLTVLAVLLGLPVLVLGAYTALTLIFIDAIK
ncbi:MAG TPA: hypothetical protein DCZ10_17825 [Pelotomaculum sp.]|nr:hypothetical protein [Pelotomaculum sp.]HBT65309.1 hypothetical protein [Oscillospiraceae bacterium]